MAQQYGDAVSITVTMEGPFGGGGTSAKLTTISLPAADWKGGESPYSQVVEVPEVSMNSMVNLQPSVEQLEIFHEKDIAFTTENVGGEVTVYAIGDKPTQDYEIQATIMEVVKK
jgi:hypothetical protein